MEATAIRIVHDPRRDASQATSPGASSASGMLRGAIRRIDEYTRPRPCTAGDFESNDYFQSCIHAVEAGYAFMGFRGLAITTAAALASTYTVRKTGSRTAGLAVGALTGGIAAAATAGLSGPTALAFTVGGTLLGGLMSLRGDCNARVRDASGGATMITGLFLPGTSKIAGAVAAGLGASQDTPLKQAAIGAVVGGALGLALGAAGLASGGALMAGAISAAGGAIGPFFGPRFSQLFRNLANDSGKLMLAGARRLGYDETKISETTANICGSFPAEFAKEGMRSFINSDHSLGAILTGGLMESIELVGIFLRQKKTPPPSPPPATQESPAVP